MSFLKMTDNLYTLLLQKLYDIMINLGISNFFNSTLKIIPEELQNEDGDMIYSSFPSI